ILWASVSVSALPSPWTITAKESSACPLAWERRAAGTNVPEDVFPEPLSALAGIEAPKLRTPAASPALISVAPARRPPLPQSALPRESPPRVPLPQRALPRPPCRSAFVFTSLPLPPRLGRGPQFRNPAERRWEPNHTPHPLRGAAASSLTRGMSVDSLVACCSSSNASSPAGSVRRRGSSAPAAAQRSPARCCGRPTPAR